MGKQQQAPGELELVRAFVNTLDIEAGEEQLGAPSELSAWLAERGLADPSLTVTASELALALALREALRAVLMSNNDGAPVPAAAAAALSAAALRARVTLQFAADATSTLEPGASGVDGALGALLAIVHTARGSAAFSRLKACRDHTCAWAFYDHTKNRSGAWCNMQVCGNRAKATAYRARRAVQG